MHNPQNFWINLLDTIRPSKSFKFKISLDEQKVVERIQQLNHQHTPDRSRICIVELWSGAYVYHFKLTFVAAGGKWSETGWIEGELRGTKDMQATLIRGKVRTVSNVTFLFVLLISLILVIVLPVYDVYPLLVMIPLMWVIYLWDRHQLLQVLRKQLQYSPLKRKSGMARFKPNQ
jgi:hypothetical protein